jgi:hypothetical protein
MRKSVDEPTGVEMFGLELVAGYLVAYAVRKAKRVSGRLDAEVDVVLDAGLEQLHGMVAGKLGADPAVGTLEREALATSAATDRTQKRVTFALEEAVEQDPDFAFALQEVLAQLDQARSEDPRRLAGFDLRGAQGIQIGDGNTQTNTFS